MTKHMVNNNGFEYVDLGLPSGTLWSIMNSLPVRVAQKIRRDASGASLTLRSKPKIEWLLSKKLASMPGTKKSAKTTGSMMVGSDEREGAKKRPFFLYILTIDK